MIDTFEFLPPGSHNPKFGIRPGVIFGKPMEFSRYYGRETDREALRAVTDEIIAEIAKLSGQEYVDHASRRKRLQARSHCGGGAANGEEPGTRTASNGLSMLSIASLVFSRAALQEPHRRLGFALCEWECLPGAAIALGLTP